MSELYAILLGEPEVYWNGKRLFFPFSKAEALLYYLLVKQQSSREELAALLWPDKEDAAARRNLRNTLYLLKKMTTEDLVVTPSRAKVLLNTAAVNITTDIQEFKEISQEESLVLYRGDFLSGFVCKDAESFESWVDRQRDSFKEDMVARLTKVIIGRLNYKEYSVAERYLKQLLILDEYNESACRTLMKLYERTGAITRAIEVYDCFRNKLGSELGIRPQSKTQEEYERIRAKLASQLSAAPAEQAAEYFFGRARELAWLKSRLDDFCAERSCCVGAVLIGEQGVGKTMIVQRVQEVMAAGRVTVLKTQCYQAEQDYPYKAWNPIFCQAMELLTQYGEILPDIWYQVIAYVFPAVLSNPALAGKTVSGYNIHAGMIEEVMCGILKKLAVRTKLLLLMDDIHWLDIQGQSVLRQLLRTGRQDVFCLATCRSEYQEQVERITGSFSLDVLVEYLTVENFSKEEVIKFSELVLPAEQISAALQQKLYEYTDGNALFLVESCKLIKMGQTVDRLSPRLRGVLRERIQAVSDNARTVLDVISVFFSSVAYHELLAVCGMNEFELVEAIEELQHKRLIQEINDLRLGIKTPVYKYSHIRIRSYVYEHLSSLRKRMIHKRAGRYLEKMMKQESFGQDVYSEILYHYSQIDEKIKVLEYTIKLAERYSCPQYELFPELTGMYSGFVFENKLQIMGYLDKIRDLLVALRAVQAPVEKLSRFQAAYLEMLGRYYIWRGDHVSGLKAIHQLLRLAGKKGFTAYLIKGYQQVVYCAIQIRKPKLIESFVDKLRQTAQEANLNEKGGVIKRFMGVACALEQKNILAEQYYRQSISEYKRLQAIQGEFSLHIAAGYNYIGDLRHMEGNLPEALYYYEQAIRVVGQKNNSAGVVIFLVNAGRTAYELREYGKAAEYLDKAAALEAQFGEYQGYWCLRSYCTLHCILALLAVRNCCFEQGLGYLKKADGFLDKYQDTYQAGLIQRVKLEISIRMRQDARTQEAFGGYVTLSATEYYQKGKTIFAKNGSPFDNMLVDELYFSAAH